MAKPFPQYFRLILGALFTVFTGVFLLWAFNEPSQRSQTSPSPSERNKEASVAELIRALEEEFVEKQQQLGRTYQGAGDLEKQEELGRKFQQLRSETLARFVEVVEKHPGDEAVFPALRWMIGSPEHAAKAIDVLLKHHLNNNELGLICLRLAEQRAPGAEKLARAVVRESKSEEAKTQALLGLGQLLLSHSNQAGMAAYERKTLRKEAEGALNAVVEQYPDVDVFGRQAGDWANAVLFELRHLAVGQRMPDLSGDDLEGERFKLSDFRGKVILLDFWAHWSAECVDMFPHQRALVQRFGRRFVMVGVNGDDQDAESMQKNEDLQLGWRSFKNHRGEGQKSISDEWNVQRWPTLYLIDQNRIIRRTWVGSPDDAVLDSEINAIVEEAEAEIEK